MKQLVFAAALVAATIPAYAADVGVSISVGQPGFYGQINIGDFPQPVLINPRPVIIRRAPVGVEPIYLHVPPGHARRWRRYCSQYNACDRPVYFVQDRWYNDVYVPRYRERHGFRDDHRGQERDMGRKDHDRGYGRDHDRH
ncbi:MAG: hypothetical protein WBX11_02780 [Thiobacillaceae bacterium]